MTKHPTKADGNLSKTPYEIFQRLLNCITQTAQSQHQPVTLQIDLRQTHIQQNFTNNLRINGDANTITLDYPGAPPVDTISRADLIEQVRALEAKVQMLQETASLLRKLIAIYEHQIIRLTAYPDPGPAGPDQPTAHPSHR